MKGPGELKRCRRGAEWALAAAAAQELGLFDALAEGPLPLPALAGRLELDPRGAGILLGVLVELGLVRADPEGYRLTGQGRARFVDRDSPDFEAPAMRQWRANIRRWCLHLEEAVREGRPPEERPGREGIADREAAPGEGTGSEEDEEVRIARFMAAMANKSPELVERVLGTCRERLREAGIEPGEVRALDLGGGPGTFARRFAGWGGRAVLAERPEVVEHVADAYGLREVPGLELWAGDFLEEFPEGPFDLVLLANIAHIYDAETNARLLRRVAAETRPGGVVAILDFVRGVSEFASLFAITMLLETERGDTYARETYERWLKQAGYGAVRLRTLDPDRQLLTARLRTPATEGG